MKAVYETLDLSEDSVIEASAGTGKTYTLERLILRFLLEKKIPLAQILVVTFTEKATSEMKERVRNLILQTLSDGAWLGHNLTKTQESLLREAIGSFDRAEIQTIHGFCHKMNRDFAIEAGSIVGADLTTEEKIFEEEYEKFLESVDLSKYHLWIQENDILKIKAYPDRLRENLKEAIRNYSPDFNKDLYLTESYFGELTEKVDSFLENFKTHIDLEFIQKLNLYKSHKESLVDFSETLLDFLGRGEESSTNRNLKLIKIFNNHSTTVSLLLGQKQFRWNKGSSEEDKENVTSMFRGIPDLEMPKPDGVIVSILARKWKEYYKVFKEENGLIDYNDMILQTRNAVRDPQLREAIRERYKVAIVDEFQDTDTAQWEIFRTVFHESKEHTLILIGDPKQSIYAFRGADIFAYMQATQQMQEQQVSVARLDTCYRSHPSLLEFFHLLFASKNYFQMENLSYSSVLAPDDYTEGAAVRLKNEEKRVRFFEEPFSNIEDLGNAIACEVLHLKQQNSDLRNRDICILVKSGDHAQTLSQILEEHKIPVVVKSKEGLFQTDEAISLRFLIEGVRGWMNREDAEDEKKIRTALLTEFFYPDESTWNAIAEGEFPGIEIIEQCAKAFASRKLDLFFETLYEKTGFMSYLRKHVEFDRKRLNYLQLQEVIVRYNPNSVEELRALFREEREDETDATMTGNNPDHDKVQVMTMHASKGLEFEVVFLAANIASPATSISFYEFYENGKTWLDFVQFKKNKKKYEVYRLQNDRRLAYVAMTRAKSLLYLPEKEKGSTFGHKNIFSVLQGLPEDERKKVEALIETIPFRGEVDGPSKNDEPAFPEAWGKTPETPLPVFSPVSSFSALKKGLKQAEAEPALREDDDKAEAFDREGFRGAWFGTLVHEILENVPLEMFQEDLLSQNEAFLREQISEHILRYPVFSAQTRPDLLHQIYELLMTSLNAPFRNGVSLAEIEPEKRFHEAEFLMRGPFGLPNKIRGFLDLVFIEENEIFVCDFKTNVLADYSKESLKKNIQQERYDLQYALYYEALQKWTSSVGSFKPGGVYYFYLRGMRTGSEDGVFYTKPDAEEIQKIIAAGAAK